MMSFFLFAALVLLIIAVGLLFWPLFKAAKFENQEIAKDNVAIFKERLSELDQEKKQGYLDDGAYRHLKLELEKNLLNDVENQSGSTAESVARHKRHWWLAAMLAVITVLGSALLYLKLGRSDDYLRYLVLQEQDAAADKKLSDFKTMIAHLRAKLTEKPEELPKWYLLAKSYLSVGEYDKAADAFYRMTRFMPQDDPGYAAIKGHYAQALFMAAGEAVTPAVIAEADAALALDAKETSALTLKGLQAFEDQDYRQAIEYWQQAKIKAAPEQIERFLDPAIASAAERVGLDAAPAAAEQPASGGGPSIPVTLALAPALKSKVSADLPVFVFARAVGGRMPLAVVKLTAGELPATIVLDDSKAVMAAGKLSSAKQVNVSARISFSGQAIEQPGDLFAEAKGIPVEKRTAPVELIIADVVK